MANIEKAKSYSIRYYDKGNNLVHVEKRRFKTYKAFDKWVDDSIKMAGQGLVDAFQDEDGVSFFWP